MATVRLETDRIINRSSFHEVCKDAFGFPGFYGMNMDAWIDCLSYIDEGDGMSRLDLAPGEKLCIEVPDVEQLRSRVPDVFADFIDCTAFVNQRHVQDNKDPMLVLVLL